MNPNVALLLAMLARLELLIEELPPAAVDTKKAVQLYGGFVMDHAAAQGMLAAVKRRPDETGVGYLMRNAERVRILPEYRWPTTRVTPEKLPQCVFAPTEALRVVFRRGELSPRDVIEMLSWLEPVWSVYPALKDPAQARITGKMGRMPEATTEEGEPT